jgi:cyclopropane-fatty-acyl-phospholipid synthase
MKTETLIQKKETLNKEKGALTKKYIKAESDTYNPMETIFQMVAGDFPSISNSWPGDYGEPSIEHVLIAQEKKYEEYFKNLGLKENAGMKVFDIGPGWGSFSNYCRKRGVHVVSVSPAEKKYQYLKSMGYDVHQGIWQEFTPDNGPFDAIVAMGSPEHFVSPEDYEAGEQENIYRRFFDYCYDLLKPGGRIGAQMMTFNGREIDPAKLQVKREGKGEEGEMYYHLGLLKYRYPDSFLPRDFYHFFACAKKGQYEVINVVDGRAHYIWTMKGWESGFWKITPLKKWPLVVGLIIKSYFDNDFRYWRKAFFKTSNRKCFEKGWMGHQFWFVEKK